MAPPNDRGDDLDVRLQWPGQDDRAETDPDPTEGSGRPQPDTDADTTRATADAPDPNAGLLAGRSSPWPSTELAAINVRLDAIQNASVLLRNLISERLVDFDQNVQRVQSHTSRDLEEFHRHIDRAISGLASSVLNQEAALGRMETSSASAQTQVSATLQAGLDELTGLLTDQVDALAEQVRRIDVRLNAEPAAVEPDPRLDAVEPALRAVETEVRSLVERIDRAPDPDPPDRSSVLGEIQSALGALPDPTADIDQLQQTIEARLAAQHRLFESRLDTQDELLRDIGESLEEIRRSQAKDRDVLQTAVADQMGQGMEAQIEAVNRSIEALRRRMTLRARPEPAIDDAAIERIADALAERLAPPPGDSSTSEPRPGRRPPRR